MCAVDSPKGLAVGKVNIDFLKKNYYFSEHYWIGLKFHSSLLSSTSRTRKKYRQLRK